MIQYILRRSIESIALILVITVFTFILIKSAPGGPSILLDPNMAPEDTERLREVYGLNRPLYEQYIRWLWQVMQGNFGFSIGVGRPVSELIGGALPATLVLSGSALFLALIVAIPLGILSAVKRDSWFDQLLTLVSFFGLSLPIFWYGLLLIIAFAVLLPWLPAGGMYTPGHETFGDLALHLILPTLALSTSIMAELVRYTRSAMLGVLRQDYVRTARSKGVGELAVIYRHAFRTALIPIVTLLGMLIPRLVGGAAVTESVFSWPGLGRLAVSAGFNQDFPTIMGITLIISVVVVMSSLIVDLLYARLDPRVSYR
ncbi:ABC transporter permease [Mesorhizobium delmotii]|uniref:Oligopeptide transport system permease protein AppB n=1 Tax=Mesorhizobium delmotii TaxID=1631247 RepID=A0A2P9AMC3_9HYPH|nr:ABC transporter permease [Mesorhizobium delmotii]SJM32265.1 Oligopeptide transport system permease protein AppB [Mesorhizobium delmotii]